MEHQLPEGGWAIYPGGPAEISASVKAYFALKLVGVPPDDPAMVRAREAILALGGVQACNSFTRFYLALLGQIEYDDCPVVPPEMVLVAVVARIQPGGDVGVDADDRRAAVDHLGLQAGSAAPGRAGHRRAVPGRLAPHSLRGGRKRLMSWANFFLVIDRVLKWAERWRAAFVAAAGNPGGASVDA